MPSSFVTPWTVALKAPLPMGFSRQEDWSGLSFPPPGDLPNPGINPASPAWAGGLFTAEPPGKPAAWRLKIRVSAGLVPPEVALLGMSVAILSLRVCVCVCVCVCVLRIQACGIRAHLNGLILTQSPLY